MGLPITNSNAFHDKELSQTPPSAPTDGAMSLEMQKLGELLSSLETVIAQFTLSNEDKHNDIANNYIKLAQEAHQKAVQAYNKYEQELQAQAHESFWEKLVGGIIAAVCCVAAVLTGQIELAVMVVAFTVLQMTGGMSDIKNSLTKLLQEAGCSPEVASLLSDAIIIAATILITHGAGGLGAAGTETAEVATTTTEETTTTVTEEVSTQAADDTSMQASQDGSNSLLARARNVIKKGGDKFKNIASKLSKRQALNLAAGSQAFIGSGAGLDIAKGIFSTLHDKKAKEALEMTLMVILDLMASIAAGAGISRLGMEGRNMGETLSSLANKGKVMKVATVTGMTATAGEVGINIAQGCTDAELAHTSKELGKSKAIIDIVQDLEKMADDEFTVIMRGETSTVSNLNKEVGSMGRDWSKLGAAISHCLELQA